nr:EOG090X0G3U [Triops cancriformis]
MSERKVLNKYYPPDFDPSKIPRVKQEKNRQFTVRLMAPFNMKCNTCGEYIYKGKKFNARKEDVENQNYLGLRIYRFYIKCTCCLSEISFKTDPESTDYVIEAGATRNFMALKLAEEQALREEQEAKEEEASNPMKLLENRTNQSKSEIELVETLEELKELNQRQQIINYDNLLKKYETERMETMRKEEEEDEKFINSVFGEKTDNGIRIKRIKDEDDDEDLTKPGMTKKSKLHAVSHPFDGPAELKSSSGNKPALVSRKVISSLVKVNRNLVKPRTESKSENKATMALEEKVQRTPTNDTPDAEASQPVVAPTPSPPQANGLSLLGAYSDSNSDSDA